MSICRPVKTRNNGAIAVTRESRPSKGPPELPGTGRREPALPPPTRSEAAFDALLATFGRPTPADRRASGTHASGTSAAGTTTRGNAAAFLPPNETPAESAPGASAFLDRLYAKSDEYLESDRFASIGDAAEFFTKVVGVTFEGRQDVIGGLVPGAPLELRREPENPFDANAIGVFVGALRIGFLRKEIARRLAPKFDGGERYRAEIASLTGGGTRSFGVNLFVRRERPPPERAIPAGTSRYSRDAVLRALLGDRPLRDAQRAVLDRVEAGRNTLAILGTGRGKSLCFQYPAAVGALERGAKTVVLYPLRALANDQFDALQRRLGPLGLRVFRANGSIDAGERAALMDALEVGAWDILCATPEFFGFHLQRFTPAVSRPALIVVDEAHHVFESKHRPAYGRIGAAIATLGSPQVLALTATAGDEAFARITSTLGVDAWVIDPTVRANLAMVDARNVTNKFAYIAARVVAPGKSIVYCNSRSEATKIAEKLRTAIGDVAFYHAGVPAAERTEIERLFRENALRVVVATSAFGEGIDLPDVRNVFLYHLNFDFTEFNQQSGRAGRDGEEAQIHLLFGEKDRRINDFILERGAPTLPTLRALYREMRRLVSAATLRMTYVDIAATLDMDKVDAGTVGAAVRIFDEAGLLETGEDDEGRFIRFRDVKEKIDLTDNSRFAEGEAERENFSRFCKLVLEAGADVLEHVINRPIYPSNVSLLK
jgi:single-stranded-DNA-specific exonuclease